MISKFRRVSLTVIVFLVKSKHTFVPQNLSVSLRLRPAAWFKKILRHRCSSVKFAKLFKTSLLLQVNAFTCFCWLPAAADFFLAVERCHFVPVGIYMFKVNSRNSTARCEIYSNLTTNTSELRQCSNRSSVKKVVLKNFANFTGNQLCWILFLIKLFEIFTSTYLEEYLRTTASDLNFFYPLLLAWNDKMQILPTEQKLCSKSTKRYQVSYYQLWANLRYCFLKDHFEIITVIEDRKLLLLFYTIGLLNWFLPLEFFGFFYFLINSAYHNYLSRKSNNSLGRIAQ